MAREFVYVGDPMCSWCWGFSPTMQQLIEDFKDELGLKVLLGGLRPESVAKEMDDELRSFLRQHWEHVEQATDQPFDYSLLERENFIYNTEPACRAVAIVRREDEEAAFSYFHDLQEAFYAHNTDITQARELAGLAQPYLNRPLSFEEEMNSEAVKEATLQEFVAVYKQLGVRGFPTLFVNIDQKLYAITTGYQPYHKLKPALTEFLKKVESGNLEVG